MKHEGYLVSWYFELSQPHEGRNTSRKITSKSLNHSLRHSALPVGGGLGKNDIEYTGKEEISREEFLGVREPCLVFYSMLKRENF